jgi:hypothetical protein
MISAANRVLRRLFKTYTLDTTRDTKIKQSFVTICSGVYKASVYLFQKFKSLKKKFKPESWICDIMRPNPKFNPKGGTYGAGFFFFLGLGFQV